MSDRNSFPEHSPRHDSLKDPIVILGGSALIAMMAGFAYTAYEVSADINKQRAIQKGCSGQERFYAEPEAKISDINAAVISRISDDTGITPLEEQITNSILELNADGIAAPIKPTDITLPKGVSFLYVPTKCADPSTKWTDFVGVRQQS